MRSEKLLFRCHAFEAACADLDIEHRLTKPRHPLGRLQPAVPADTDRRRCRRWTNGQVERMNRTLKDATVKRYHYGRHDELRRHLQLFVDACNDGRRLKTLRGLTPYEAICKAWTEQPARFTSHPSHLIPGPNS